MAHKIVFLNGPPRVGKDTIGNELFKRGLARRYKMSKPLKEAFKSIFMFSDQTNDAMLEEYKDNEYPHLLGGFRTTRGFQIKLSEEFLKLHLGKDCFGRIAARFLDTDTTLLPITAITDAGFDEECVPLIEKFGRVNCLLVRVTRQGTDFSNDSRSYIDLSRFGVRSIDIVNRYDKKEDPELFEAMIDRIVSEINKP
jgi:hypothetical protein